jgi:hypothetical protein
MSEENRPNLNAVGLMCDIVASLEHRIRGNAGKAGMKVVFPLLKDEIQKFVEKCDEMLDLLEASAFQ